MFELALGDLLQLLLVSLFAGILDTIVGFGGGLLLLPIAILILGGSDAVVLSALVPIGWNAVRIPMLRGFFDRDAIRLFLIGVLPGVLLGAWVLHVVSEEALRFWVGIVLIILGSYHVLRLYVELPGPRLASRYLFPATGFVGATLASAIGAGNGPLQSWSMVANGLRPQTIVAVNGLIGLVMGLLRLGAYGVGGMLDTLPWAAAFAALGVAVVGGVIGIRLARRTPDSTIKLLIGVVIVVAGVRLVSG